MANGRKYSFRCFVVFHGNQAMHMFVFLLSIIDAFWSHGVHSITLAENNCERLHLKYGRVKRCKYSSHRTEDSV